MNLPGARTRLFVIFLCFLAVAALGAAEADKPKGPVESHKETLVIGRDAKTRFGRLSTLRLDGDGNLLACDAAKKHIRVISPAGKTLATWPLKLAPDAMWRCADGDDWLLYWFGPSSDPKLVSVNFRPIRLINGEK